MAENKFNSRNFVDSLGQKISGFCGIIGKGQKDVRLALYVLNKRERENEKNYIYFNYMLFII